MYQEQNIRSHQNGHDKFVDSEKEKAACRINVCPAFVGVIYSCHMSMTLYFEVCHNIWSVTSSLLTIKQFQIGQTEYLVLKDLSLLRLIFNMPWNSRFQLKVYLLKWKVRCSNKMKRGNFISPLENIKEKSITRFS